MAFTTLVIITMFDQLLGVSVTMQMCYPFAGNLCTPVLDFGT